MPKFENALNFNNPEIIPTETQLEVDDEVGKSDALKKNIRKREFRNLERGTSIGFATIPLVEAQKLDQIAMENILKENFGENITFPEKLSKATKFLSDENFDMMIISYLDKTRPNYRGMDDIKHLSLKKIGKKVLITETSFVHDFFLGQKNVEREDRDAFEDLVNILEQGFISQRDHGHGFYDNALTKGTAWGKKKDHRFNFYGIYGEDTKPDFISEKGVTKGDAYSIELYSDTGRGSLGGYGLGQGHITFEQEIKSASPQRILSVNILIDLKANESEREKKMQFYKTEITEKYKIPVRFYLYGGKKDIPMKRIFPRRDNESK